MVVSPRLFLLSPAHVGGVRAGYLLNPRAQFPLARQFQAEGLPLGVVFTFASGLYFRGKLTYAQQFAHPSAGDLVRVITSNAGLADPASLIGPEQLTAFGRTDIAADDPQFYQPLRRDARQLAVAFGREVHAILLGSVATAKYREVLLEVFGPRLLFPPEFVGRGDMSRGALLLRAARTGEELTYVPVAGAKLTGTRAPRVTPVRPAQGKAKRPLAKERSRK